MAKAENKAVQDDVNKPVEGATTAADAEAAEKARVDAEAAEKARCEADAAEAAEKARVDAEPLTLTAWLRNNVDAGNITFEEAQERMAAHLATCDVSYPTVDELRDLEPELLDSGKFSNEFLEARLAKAIAEVERICERRFVRTRLVEVHVAHEFNPIVVSEGSTLHGGGPVETVTVTPPGGTLENVDVSRVWLDAAGVVCGLGVTTGSKVVVTYLTGPASCPPEISELVAVVARLFAQRKNAGLSERVDRFALGDTGTPFMLAVPGVRRLGMPEIDAELQRHSLHTGMAAATGAVLTVARV
jgi:hypothetical protein